MSFKEPNFTFKQVTQEMQRLLNLWFSGAPFLFKLEGGNHDLVNDVGTFTLTVSSNYVAAHEPIVRQIPQRDLQLSLEMFSTRHLLPMVEQIPLRTLRMPDEPQLKIITEPTGQPEPPSPGEFAEAPKSFNEMRADKERRANLRTVRDMPVEILRTIDSGDLDYQDLRVGVVVIHLKDRDGDRCTHWYAGGHDFNLMTGVGLLHRGAFMLQED